MGTESKIITYDGKPFPNGLAEPFVSITESPIYYGEKWGVLEEISLSGIISGCDYSGIQGKRNNILGFFSNSYRTFNFGGFTREHCVVRSINFDESDYFSMVPYTVVLAAYPDLYFTKFAGVINVSNEWNYQETDDSTVLITHQIQATGINNAKMAIQNAKDFVDANKVEDPEFGIPQYITIETGKSAFLISEKESVDRFTASVSLTRTYVVDQENSYGGILRYLITKDEKLGEFVSVNLSGSFSGGIDANMSDIRNELKEIDFLEIAKNVESGLNSVPSAQSFTENVDEKTITFNFEYENIPDGVSVSSTVGVERGEEAITRVSISGSVFGRGSLKSRYADVSSHFGSLDIFSIAEKGAKSLDPEITLDPNPESFSSEANKFTGEITFSASYSDREIAPGSFESLDYSISISPSLQKVNHYNIVNKEEEKRILKFLDFDYHTRGRISINGSGILKKDALIETAMNELKALMNVTVSAYIKPRGSISETAESKGYSLNEESIDFSFEWSYDSNGPINPSQPFTEVKSLI